jgi:hypothetical protein
MNTIEIERAIANVKATLAMEKLQASEKSKEITRRYLEGKITSDKAIMEIKLIYI